LTTKVGDEIGTSHISETMIDKIEIPTASLVDCITLHYIMNC